MFLHYFSAGGRRFSAALLIAGALAGFTGPAAAQDSDPVADTAPDSALGTLRAAALAGDFAALDAAIRAAADGDQARAIFALFNSTDPAIDRATKAWLATDPANPRAMTARGWTLRSRGFALRGEGYIDDVLPAAYAGFRSLHGEAWDLALAAVKADPASLPASDLKLSVAYTTGHSSVIPVEFARMMELAPNRQTLLWASAGMAPQWGGKTGWGREACALWADRIPEPEGYDAAGCATEASFFASDKAAIEAWARAALRADDSPFLDAWRSHDAVYGRADGEADRAWAKDWLTRQGANSDLTLRQAIQLERMNGRNPQGDGPGPVLDEILRRDLAAICRAADQDPGNWRKVFDCNEGLSYSRYIGLTRDKAAEVARLEQLVRLAPYDPYMWEYLASELRDSTAPDQMTVETGAAMLAAFRTALALSGNAPDFASRYERFAQGIWNDMDRINVDAIDTTGAPAFAKEAFDSGIVCPVVHAIRLHRGLCEETGARNAACEVAHDQAYRVDYLDRARRRGACEQEGTLTRPLHELKLPLPDFGASGYE